MATSFRARLTEGKPLLGTLITLTSLETAEILAATGFDWIWLDLEHSPLGPLEAQAVMQAVSGRTDVIIRVPLNDEIWIKKVLDTGASGILVPQVNTAEEARRAVRFSKYPPVGTRSVGVSRAHAYGTNLQGYLENANQSLAVIVQAEHILAVEHIEEIAAVEGLDAVLIGPYDLSASMGIPGQVESPEVQAAIRRVLDVCRSRGLPAGIFAATGERARAFVEQGFTLVGAASDTLLLDQAARALLAKLRG